jgi:hypothetical protein
MREREKHRANGVWIDRWEISYSVFCFTITPSLSLSPIIYSLSPWIYIKYLCGVKFSWSFVFLTYSMWFPWLCDLVKIFSQKHAKIKNCNSKRGPYKPASCNYKFTTLNVSLVERKERERKIMHSNRWI